MGSAAEEGQPHPHNEMLSVASESPRANIGGCGGGGAGISEENESGMVGERLDRHTVGFTVKLRDMSLENFNEAVQARYAHEMALSLGVGCAWACL